MDLYVVVRLSLSNQDIAQMIKSKLEAALSFSIDETPGNPEWMLHVSQLLSLPVL